MEKDTLEARLKERIGTEFSTGILALGDGHVKKWILRRGMEFQSPWIWWGDVNKTRKETYGGGPHEGVDFALGVMTDGGRIKANMQGVRVPLFTDGTPVWCFKDLVGDTVIVKTDVELNDSVLLIQYSHIEFEDAQFGKRYAMGTDIGKIKLSENPKSATASHLHISTGLLNKSILELSSDEVDFKNWLEWDVSGELVYIDPLALVSDSVKEGNFLMGEAAQSPIHSIICGIKKMGDPNGLKRHVTREFPGLRILRKSPVEAQENLHRRGLLILISEAEWEIQIGEDLSSVEGMPLAGQGREHLVESIRGIEAANA